ncbi:MAG: DUF72 domain-containing protein [Candidatus Eisenbacteria bacterium]|nr:DUF72 domain-containing protein [Candidatus Eisenbacteria bacterium]
MGRIRIGVSGWNYDSWRGAFYPTGLPRSRQLEEIGRRFSSVEINGSFYALLKPETYRTWHAATPRDFVFAVKGSRFITHNKKLRDARTPLANFLASGVLALGEKLGPIVWQLPERLAYDRERLERFLDLLPHDHRAAARLARRHDRRLKGRSSFAVERNHRLRHALEVRNESYFHSEFVGLLRRAGVALVCSDSADWPRRTELTAGFVYVRLHGSRTTYASRYPDAELADWARRIRSWRAGRQLRDAERITRRAPPRRKSRDVYVYFDNDRHAHAPRDAQQLIARIR